MTYTFGKHRFAVHEDHPGEAVRVVFACRRGHTRDFTEVSRVDFAVHGSIKASTKTYLAAAR
jgi:hypothetical protein